MKRALFIGRFQPFHSGHHAAVSEIATNSYDEIVIGIGSSQYANTLDNPLTYEERKHIIEYTLRDEPYFSRLHIIAIPDINDDAHWVEHVNEIVGNYDCVYSGNPWPTKLFAEAGIPVISPTISVDINATTIREMITQGDNTWKHYVHPLVQDLIEQRIN